MGGWAIDLFVGRQTRDHADLEIALPRPHFSRVREVLAGFAFYVVDNGAVRLLDDGALPPDHTHQNWVLDTEAGAWRVDVMLEPGDDDTWVFRRDERVQAPRSSMTGYRDSVPYLKPQGSVLYKAKRSRPKDEADLLACLPLMDETARAWLASALERAHPAHPWLAQLARLASERG